jgi:hypothetical protein
VTEKEEAPKESSRCSGNEHLHPAKLEWVDTSIQYFENNKLSGKYYILACVAKRINFEKCNSLQHAVLHI